MFILAHKHGYVDMQSIIVHINDNCGNIQLKTLFCSVTYNEMEE